MERLQIREISRLLAQAQHLSIGDAERFVTEMFSTVYDGLKADKQVIINGFGTFKQTVFKEKESVSFIPDVEIAEQINAPFANFKTVEITVEEPSEAGSGESEFLEIQEFENPGTENPKQESQESEPPSTGNRELEALTEKVDALTEKIEEKARKRKKLMNSLLIFAVTLAILSLCGGAYYSIRQQNKAAEEAAKRERIAAKQDAELKHKQDSINTIKKNIASLDLTDEQKREVVGVGKPDAPEYPCAMSLEEAKSLMPRTAYKITGTVTVYTVQEGKTIPDIAQEYGLQQGEFLIQVYNAIESVKEGQKIRIPLVELK